MHHQEEGVEFLLSRRSGLIAFEQGLGKTLVAIEAFVRLRAQRAVDHLLVICPNSLKHTWANELARHAPSLQFRIIGGSVKERRELIGDAREPVVIINYEAARKDITPLRAFLRSRRCALVLDESHLAKNRLSLNATAATHFAELTRFRWLLTGTPVTNTPADVYSQIHLVTDGQPLGSFGYFTAVLGNDTEALARKIKPHLLRRTKEECLDLPDKTFVDLVIPLPAWQRRLYDDARDGLLHEVEGMTDTEFRSFAPNALTKLLRLAQIASNPKLVFEAEARTPAKQEELDHLLEELIGANKRKVIVWSYYVDTIKALRDRYAAYGVVTLFGETPSDERQAIATQFQHDEATKLLVANPAAAGTGFTLTAANYTIYESLTWRYDLYAQSQDRNHRIGQTLPVTYLRLLAEDTIDSAILGGLHRKAQLGPQLLGDVPAHDPVLGLTREEFCRMLTTNRFPHGEMREA
jgi:SNF2 family DNA or RNA helicase